MVDGALRSKTDTAQQEDRNGKKVVVKLGMKAEQRDGFEYEMTIVLDLTHDGHLATVSKDRTNLFADAMPGPVTAETGAKIGSWLACAPPADAPPVAAPEQPSGESSVLDTFRDTALASIKLAATLNELRRHYNAAYIMASEANDAKALKDFEEAKNVRKKALTEAA